MGESKKEGSKKRLKLKAALEEKTKEAEEYLSQLKYLKADFENFKKRMEREKEDYISRATERLIVDILDVVDNFERAIEAGKSGEESKESLLEGVEMTYKQLMKILEKQGVEPIKAEGEPFDPHLHECVMTENSEEYEEDFIIQEFQKGYMMNSRVIRHSKVKITKR